MNVSAYKTFKQIVRTGDEKSPIWWAGYMWLNLTKRQTKEIVGILIDRGFPVEDGFKGKMVKIPSGLGIFLDQEVPTRS